MNSGQTLDTWAQQLSQQQLSPKVNKEQALTPLTLVSPVSLISKQYELKQQTSSNAAMPMSIEATNLAEQSDFDDGIDVHQSELKEHDTADEMSATMEPPAAVAPPI